MSLDELAALCRRRGWRLTLEVVDATGHPLRSQEGAAACFLRVRVYDRDGAVLAGRCQSESGLELPRALAEGVLAVLHRRGVVA